ncbi:hypothetical protein Q4Q35_04185 [Flavivirga aquimarina]|uniref:Fibronectin type-III domain-containing protein n=1 Tax=Flavivirga aquimarina TaxID=2027862 RepID=A0ABT8W7A1_9FLAO|nr:hypothetical protein [Flavivirga aquimarina]MDO5968998.1 hypothetical protein [Flavivirga aquimarina]
MKIINNTFLAIILLFLSLSCDDILEEDITNDNVQISFPKEGTVIEGNTVQFTWQSIDGADDYRVQVITSNQILEVDSLMSTNTFVYTLNPGSYQWRIRGENFAYETTYTFPVNFSVETSDDLSNQNVSLLTPSIDFYTNNANIICTWNELSNVSSYSFELIKNLSGEQTVFKETGISSNSLTIDADVFDEDAEYIWKVKAINETSETQFSQRSLFLDREIPNQPALASPEDQDTTTTTVTFNWTNGVDSGNIKSSITNTIEIASDVNFNSIIHSANTENNTVQYTFTSTGTYYWRIKAIDAAGNESDYSIVRSIIVE